MLTAALPAAAAATVGEAGSTWTAPVPAVDDPASEGPPSGTVRLMGVGDLELAQSIGRRIVKNGPLAPWQDVKQYFDQADLVVANLECTISERGTRVAQDVHLPRARWPPPTRSSPAASMSSRWPTTTPLTTAATRSPIRFGCSTQRSIGHVGGGANLAAARAPLIVERNGLRIAFLGYVLPFSGRPNFSTRQWAATDNVAGLALGTPDVVAADVDRGQAGWPMSSWSWSTAESSTARRPNKTQRNFDRAAIAAGASLVIGHHPHVLQGYVLEDKTAIAYSTGDFVFDYFVGAPNDTAILDVTLSAQGVERLAWIPIEIQKGFPRPASAPRSAASTPASSFCRRLATPAAGARPSRVVHLSLMQVACFLCM